MIVYRLANEQFINDFTGVGAKMYGGRWNPIGLAALYTTEHISLAVLEILVHIKSFRNPHNYHLVSMEIPDSTNFVTIDLKKLNKKWRDDYAYTQFLGEEYLKAGRALVLKVPSAIIETESNFIINPAHPDAGKLKIIGTKIFVFDKRLYLKDE